LSVVVSVAVGMSVFTLPQGIAVVLVFSGVWLVIKSKSKRDMQKHVE
jgi:drug/metabolite transporter (DMT)-like permease